MSKDDVLALADSVHEAGTALVEAIPDEWWLAKLCDLTGGPESIRQAVQRVQFYGIWREKGNEVIPEPPNGKDSGLIAADAMALSVAVLLKNGPSVIVPFARRDDQARAARLTGHYMDVRGPRFLTGVL